VVRVVVLDNTAGDWVFPIPDPTVIPETNEAIINPTITKKYRSLPDRGFLSVLNCYIFDLIRMHQRDKETYRFSIVRTGSDDARNDSYGSLRSYYA
jgi:hypothetical protein